MSTECEPGGHTTQCSTQQSQAVQGPLSHSTTHVSAHIPTLVTPLKVPAAQALLSSPQSNLLQSSFTILLQEPTGIVSPGSATICCVALVKSLNFLDLFLSL